jgi:hypothetical protein
MDSGIVGQQSKQLLLRDSANLETLRPAAITAKNSNSRFGRFQKFCEILTKSFVGAIFHRWRLQPYFESAIHLTNDFVAACPWLDANGHDYHAIPLLNVQHPAPLDFLFYSSCSEQRGANTNFRRALLDSDLEIVGHAHREHRQRPAQSRLQIVAQLP